MSSGAHILVVDDDPDLLRLLSMRLSGAGYRVTACASAEEALVKIAMERPQLVLSDVQLPGKDGLALFDAIRVQHPSLPVILLTAHGTIPDAVEATSRGVFTYLTKPFDGKALLDIIANALAWRARPRRPPTAARWRRGARRSSAAPTAWPRCWPRPSWWRPPTPAC
jgi:two-component system response regulator GlrR